MKVFENLFNQLCYKHEDYKIFDDFLEMLICNFSFDFKWNKIYTDDEKKIFSLMFREWIMKLSKEIKYDESWFDFFGQFYELSISSKSRRQNAGQFFTPEPICNFMAQITANKEMTGKKMSVSDPACGSGRNLLAFNAIAPGNYLCGEDIDRTCCLMTVCNFIVHGIEGEIIHHNSLDPHSFFSGWATRYYKGLPIIQVSDLKKEDSFVYRANQKKLLERQTELKTEQVEYKKIQIEADSGNYIQLNLFE